MTILGTGAVCFLLAAFLSTLPLHSIRRYTYSLSAAGALGFGAASLTLLFSPPTRLFVLDISSALQITFYGDALTGFFLLVISVLAFAVSIYSLGYTRGMVRAGAAGFLYNTFILSMYAVVLSGNILTFLISWETMSLLSYFLVTSQRDDESAGAGLLYAVMTHAGTAFIIVAFLILYAVTGHMDLASIKEASSSIPASLKNIVFLCSFIGFGTKAGIIPLHTWLPRAHPAAPSNISALMSGVMIKTGIYGLIRVNLDLLQTAPEWWGISSIIIGGVSCILGVLYALMEHDIKRLLAYHSVENIGIILLGIGAAITLKSAGMHTASSIALAAALYHTLNHAVFKGLLFLGAGSVMHAAHTGNMEHMGGLLKVMPFTGLFFLVGSVSICALPPFNGFVSEWLTYQALLSGFHASSIAAKIIAPLGGAALAVTGALAAACFVKAFGISFLGLPRTPHAEAARESSPSMLIGMGLLALCCLAFGIFPELVIRVLSPAVSGYTGVSSLPAAQGFLQIGETLSSLSPAAILFSMVIMGAATAMFILFAGGRKKISRGDAWDCGIPALTARMQYTATAFTKPLRLIFRRIYLPRRELTIAYRLKPLFVRSIQYSGEITPFFEKYLYSPVMYVLRMIADRTSRLQSGSLHLYLGYILATLIILIILGVR